MRALCVTALLMIGITAAPAAGQSTLDHPTGQMEPYFIDTGMLQAGPAVGQVSVFEDTIQIDDAAWLRVYFGDVQLSEGSFIRLTSLQDGEVQELDAETLAMWNNTSAYFNGDALDVELVAAPGSTNQLIIEEVALEHVMRQAAGGGGQCGICGATDDRVPSDELWTGRLLPAGCTASVFQTDSCMVSAGHCIGGSMVVQFNVPLSNANCSLNHPPITEQFPMIGVDFTNGGPGNDWSVLVCGTNNVGETAYDRYGQLRPVSGTVATAGQACELTGYGVDLTCTLSQTQQFDDGFICQTFATAYDFSVDLRGGNSGSSLIRNDEIIGIATHCPCCNVATRIDHPNFVAARVQLCPNETQTTTLPFFDEFPDVELDESLWTGVEGAEGGTRGINEPSPILSLDLDATNPGGDEARSAVMNVTTLTNPVLNYWYEQTGIDDPPEDGDDLVIEYMNASENWVELNRHFGADPDMTDYEFVSISLPPEAVHAGFRLRIRAISDDSGSDDDWFVDDVCIDADDDGDGICNLMDVCPGGDDTVDTDGDSVPDACDVCPMDNPDDTDGDGVCDSDDVCAGGDDTVDTDGDSVPDDCDPCPADNPDDTDGDGVCDSADVCPGGDDTVDTDGDSVPDDCDPCPADNPDDTDGDGVCDSNDPCPLDNPDDTDGDGVCDSSDPCPLDNPDDTDGDGVCDSSDVCPGFDDNIDADGDTVPDGCDVCPGGDDTVDTDGDGIPDDCDCPHDISGDGSVEINDLLALLAAWGTDPGGPPDFNGDNTVNIDDLLDLLANWGPC